MQQEQRSSTTGRHYRVLLLAVMVLFTATCVRKPQPMAHGLLQAPLEPAFAQPNLPAQVRVFGQVRDLRGLENPLRAGILKKIHDDPAGAAVAYGDLVAAGQKIFYTHGCVQCHGDLLDGAGMFALGQDPKPTDLRHSSALDKHSEGYVFWRIATGGPGLPRQNQPWRSMMPAFQDDLSETQIWQLITFMYDRVGQLPALKNPQAATMAALQQRRNHVRASLTGKTLFETDCSICHGKQGQGDGVAAKFFYPKPRDFSIGIFKYQTSPPTQDQPTDGDLFTSIKFGLTRTAMPAWGVELSDAQIRSLVPVVKRFDTVGSWAPEDAPDEEFDDDGYYTGALKHVTERLNYDRQVPFSDASVKAGKADFDENCTPCHGNDGRGNPAVEKNLRDDWGARIWPRDLTKPWTWRESNVPGDRSRTIQNIFTRLSVGIPGTPMPEHYSGIAEPIRWNMANYEFTLRQRSPDPSLSPVIRGHRIPGALPDSVNDPHWFAATAVTTLVMIPNLVSGKRLYKPLRDSISVRVLYNDTDLGLLLEIDDRTRSIPGDADAEAMKDPAIKQVFSDAIAVVFPKKNAYSIAPGIEKPLLPHGDADHGTTLWYWDAGSVTPKRAPGVRIFDGGAQSPKPRAQATGLSGAGQWSNGRWRIELKHPRISANEQDVGFGEGKFIPVSFAGWDGSNAETGSKHMFSAWYWLVLDPAG